MAAQLSDNKYSHVLDFIASKGTHISDQLVKYNRSVEFINAFF